MREAWSSSPQLHSRSHKVSSFHCKKIALQRQLKQKWVRSGSTWAHCFLWIQAQWIISSSHGHSKDSVVFEPFQTFFVSKMDWISCSKVNIRCQLPRSLVIPNHWFVLIVLSLIWCERWRITMWANCMLGTQCKFDPSAVNKIGETWLVQPMFYLSPLITGSLTSHQTQQNSPTMIKERRLWSSHFCKHCTKEDLFWSLFCGTCFRPHLLQHWLKLVRKKNKVVWSSHQFFLVILQLKSCL